MTELEFIKLVKEKRNKMNLSQKDLAKLIFIPYTTLCKIENGVQKLNFNTIKALAIVLDIDLNQIKDDFCFKNALYYD